MLHIKIKSGKDYQRHAALDKVMENRNYAIPEAFVFQNDNVRIWKRFFGMSNSDVCMLNESHILLSVDSLGEPFFLDFFLNRRYTLFIKLYINL